MNLEPLSPDILRQYLSEIDALQPCFDRGGFKWVYRAVVHGRDEALKALAMREVSVQDGNRDQAESLLREQYARIHREIQALAKCNVPEIVKLGTIAPVEFENEGTHYLAYSEEFVDGADLWKIIRSRTAENAPSLAELVSLFNSLLRCVQELWRHGYVHRDIKPKNVMKSNDPLRPFILLDLGIAFAVDETNLTFRPEERMPPATYRYLAPEMLQPDFRERIDYRTDLYTTGMTVYEYAAGKHPLAKSADDLMQTISRALRQPPTPLREHRPDLPMGFCTLVDGMLKKKPALRPANLKLLIQKLEGMK
jgi:eukaryotic-like serine/threonine-protein kinase